MKTVGMFGLSEEKVRSDYGVTLMPDAARAALDALKPKQIRVSKPKEAWGADLKVEVSYKGRWRELCRTDLHRQVATSHGCSSDPLLRKDPVKYYRGMIVYGAFVEDDAFMVIDSLTDG